MSKLRAATTIGATWQLRLQGVAFEQSLIAEAAIAVSFLGRLFSAHPSGGVDACCILSRATPSTE